MINLETVTETMRQGGFVAADDEARELVECSNGDAVLLAALVDRRMNGEPLAWITGFSMFCGTRVKVSRGVYVPRWQSEPLARRAASRLTVQGVAIDLCTGSGAIAKVLTATRPQSRVVATDIDEHAVACAAANGVEVYLGDLFSPLPQELKGRVDVVVGVVPYVPTRSMALLPHDTFVFETVLSYDGGDDGTDVLRRVIGESPRYLRSGGALLLELGGDEAEILQDELQRNGFNDVTVVFDEEDDVRGIEATYGR